MILLGVGVLGVRIRRPATIAMMPFLIWYVCAALWSASPLWGLAWKSLFTCAFVAGLVYAHGIREREDLIQGLRILMLVTGILGVASLRAALANPVDSLRGDRLAVGGICANTIAVNCAMSLVLSLYVALNDASKVWRALAAASACGHVAIIGAAGSRTGAAVGMFVLLVSLWPAVRRPIYLVAVSAGVLAAGLLFAAQVGNEKGLDRILHHGVAKRWEVLSLKARAVGESPIVGQGAVVISGRDFHGLSNVNSHNLYIQMGVELGCVGLAFFLGGLAIVAYRAVRMYQGVRSNRLLGGIAIVPVAMIGAVLVEGMGSSGTLGSTQFTTLFLGVGVGLIDRIPELATR
jgi:O-antigen ligase